MKGFHTFWIAYTKVSPFLLIILFGFFLVTVQQRDNCRINLEKAQFDRDAAKYQSNLYYQAWEASENTNSHRETYGFWYELQAAKDSIEACTGKPYKILNMRYPIQSIEID